MDGCFRSCEDSRSARSTCLWSDQQLNWSSIQSRFRLSVILQQTVVLINLINGLADNGCLILTGFGKKMNAHCGEVICSVTIAPPLDAPSLAEMKLALHFFLQKDETIKLETKKQS